MGFQTLRLKGDYPAIATLGVSEIIWILIVNGGTLTNGAAGILGLPAFTTWQLVYLFVVITTIFTINFLRSPIGRSTLSVREDEIAAESVGINTTKVKVIAFVFGAITAAIAGSLQAGFIGSVVPKDYSFTNTINVLIIVVFGGLGSMSGTVLAAIVLGILNMVLQDSLKCTYDHLLIGFDSRDDLPSRWSSWNMGIQLEKTTLKKEAN